MKKISILLLFMLSFNLIVHAKVTITMEKDGGVYKVPCVVNGLRMKFIFDTGAATVCISESMANYMLENDYLNTEDILGVGQSSVADGRIVDHVRIKLSIIEVGGLKLNDVEAIVISGQSAPLLLGQSAISAMGKISIIGNQLIIENSGECDNETIDSWANLANSYFDKGIYSKALVYYQKVYDCDGLSDYGIYLMAKCYEALQQYEIVISLLETLIIKIEKGTSTLAMDTKSYVYGLIAVCYLAKKNYQACVSYDKIALNYIPEGEWEFRADTHYEMALCYEFMKDYAQMQGFALLGIRTILEHKYPSVYKEWERNNFNDLGIVLGNYRWAYEEKMGTLLFMINHQYEQQMGSPHCLVLRVAAEMGCIGARDELEMWRSCGTCR